MAITAIKPKRLTPETTTHNFLWCDLSSSNVDAARDFYTRVLGWEWKSTPMPGSEFVYHEATLGGLTLAGLGGTMSPEQPTAWNNYVFVEDVDATVAKALELGAKSLTEAMDIPEAGRHAMLIDPSGAGHSGETGAIEGANAPSASPRRSARAGSRRS